MTAARAIDSTRPTRRQPRTWRHATGISTRSNERSRILRVPSRRFTVDEANRLIPRLEMLMERLLRSAATIRTAYHRGDFGTEIHTTTDVMRVYPELAPHVRDMESVILEIEEL